MLEHCIETLSSVLPAAAGIMTVGTCEHLSVQIFEVLQAPMHACALHQDAIGCLAEAAGSMTLVMLEHLSVQMFEVVRAPMHACASH